MRVRSTAAMRTWHSFSRRNSNYSILVALAITGSVIFWPGKNAPVQAMGPSAPREETALSAANTQAEPCRECEAAMPVEDVRATVATFTDATIPLEIRKNRLGILSEKNDASALEVLMALGDERAYLNRMAVEAVGAVKDPALVATAEAYLKGKLTNSGGDAGDDLQVTCAAARAYARLKGAAAGDELARCLVRNRTRSDCNDVQVCSEIVEALASCASAAAAPILSAELERSTDPRWSLEYGSLVVQTLSGIDSPEGWHAIAAYADRLDAFATANPMARATCEQKISEARNAARARIQGN